MGDHPEKHGKNENQLIGNILQDDTDDFYDMRMAMGKSTSAPPPGLSEVLTSSSPDPRQNSKFGSTSSKEYYEYYYSLKPHDPRLPKPTWNPYESYHEQIPEENEGHEHPQPKHNQMTIKPQSTSQQPISGDGQNYGSFDQDNDTDMFNAFQNNQDVRKVNTGGPKKQNYNQGGNQYQQGGNQYYQKNNNQMGGKNKYGGNQHNQGGFGQQNQGGFGKNQYGGNQQNQGGFGQQHQGGYNKYNQNNQFGNQPQMGQQSNMMFNSMGQNMNQYDYQNQMYKQNNQFGANNQMGQFNNNMFGGGFNSQMNQNPMNNFQMQNQNPNRMQQGMNQYYINNNPNYINYYPQGNNSSGSGFQQGGNQFDQPNIGNMNQMGHMQQGGNFQGMNKMQQGGGGHGHNSFGGQNQGSNMGQGGKQNFKNQNQNQKMDIKYVLSHLIESCKDQNGSRLIQLHFEKANDDEKNSIFEQIKPQAVALMQDVFGNYVIQKILEHGTHQQKLQIFECAQGRIVDLSSHTYGCRVIQRALEEFKLESNIQDEILSELKTNILALIQDQNGNHVIQKCFETIQSDKLMFIIEVVTEKINDLAFHAYGCRVIQRILEHSTQDKTQPMINKLMKNCLQCCQCQYGNYIMQHLLEKGPQKEKDQLLTQLQPNFVRLSMNKFASNVTEKSVLHGSMDFKRGVKDVLLNTFHENKLGLVALMNHPYGNYVVQRLFENSDDQVRLDIYKATQGEHAEELKKNNHGKHVMGFIEKFMEKK